MPSPECSKLPKTHLYRRVTLTDVESDGVGYITFWVHANPESNREEDHTQSRGANPTTDTPTFGSHYQAPDETSGATGSGTHHAGFTRKSIINLRCSYGHPSHRSYWPYATAPSICFGMRLWGRIDYLRCKLFFHGSGSRFRVTIFFQAGHKRPSWWFWPGL